MVATKFFNLLPLGFLLTGSANLFSHDIDVTSVARLLLDELDTGQYSLSVVDQQVPPLFNLQNSIPANCTSQPPSRYSYRFSCDPALLSENSLSFPWGLEGVVVVAKWLDGTEASGYFPGDGNFIEVPMSELKAGSGSLLNLASRYLALGVEHILFGIDHLLFVLGLLLLVKGFWTLIKTVTAFTVAHSLTLACAVLGYIPLPGAPIEALIALSILFLAREILMGQRGQITLVHYKPWLVAFVFGLIHGFGFASALGELGLRDGDIPLALLFFNLGVEAGQVAFIGLLVLFNFALGKLLERFIPWIQTTLAYCLGGVATFWFIERLSPLIIV
ncbi:MAG: HupE/UreJ family protein [Gammaproteobacteria bacterium]|jgi:hydrogenase/urease accessory protein HupE|nr:HupE/UreJ family protein [Gammaproteobacteria bacterium]|tara:strand:+ start:4587 stop:5582 length:996 start_codon:yes stop_codon:yes gene_type:complete